MSQDEEELDEYFYDNEDGSQDDADYTDEDNESSDDEDSDNDNEQIDLLYRCNCKWKGGESCSAAFENEGEMWTHLTFIHRTSKWLVKIYSRIY